MNLQTSILFSYAFNNFVRVCVCFSSSYGKLRLQGRKNNNNNSNNKICKKRLKQTTITTRKQRYDIEIQRATCHLSHFRILRLILFWKAHEEERKIEAGRKREKKSWQRCAKERLAGRAEGERERDSAQDEASSEFANEIQIWVWAVITTTTPTPTRRVSERKLTSKV